MEVMKKFIKKLYMILFVVSLSVLTISCCSAKDFFTNLDFIQQDNNQPVPISENEIFFPGGSYNKTSKCYNSAKIYNIKDHKFINTAATMNVPRYNYGAIKYDNNNILIVGGFCSDSSKNTYSCSQIAEIYSIKDKKFTQISNTNLNYDLEIRTLLLDDKKIFILSGGQFEIFDGKSKSFSVISNKGQFNPTRHEYLYTINNFVYPNIIQLNQKEILIYGVRPLNTVPNRELFAMEIFNLETQTSTNIPVDYNKLSYINIGSPIKINNDTILFIGAGKDKKDVIEFDIKNKSFEYYNKLLKPLSNNGFLLSNGKVLFVRGSLFKPDYVRGTSLEHAVYDYKTNKIHNYKISRDSYYTTHFVNMGNNTVYISGYKDNQPMLYKY